MLLKILREREAESLFDREWEVLVKLRQSESPGANLFTTLVPQPVVRGLIEHGPFQERRAMAFQWATGFEETLEAVRRAYPQGIDPRIAIWMWRRILELLTFLHRSGFAHGAVLPPHILVQNGEHGIRLADTVPPASRGRHWQPSATGSNSSIPIGGCRRGPT